MLFSMLLLSCKPEHFKKHWIVTQDDGEIIDIYYEKDDQGHVRFYDIDTGETVATGNLAPGESVEDVVPEDFEPAGSVGNSARNAADAPGRSIIVLTHQGTVIERGLQPPANRRSLKTSQNLSGGVHSGANGALYVGSRGPVGQPFTRASILEIDFATFQVTRTIQLPPNSLPQRYAVTPDGAFLYVAASVTVPFNETRVHVIDTAARSIVKTLTYPGSRRDIDLKMTPDGGLAFVTIEDAISVINSRTHEVSHRIPHFFIGRIHLAVDITGSQLYVAPAIGSGGRTGVRAYDIASAAESRFIPMTDLVTMSMALSPNGRLLVIQLVPVNPVTQRNDWPVVRLVDLDSGTVEREIPWTGSRSDPLTVHSLFVEP